MSVLSYCLGFILLVSNVVVFSHYGIPSKIQQQAKLFSFMAPFHVFINNSTCPGIKGSFKGPSIRHTLLILFISTYCRRSWNISFLYFITLFSGILYEYFVYEKVSIHFIMIRVSMNLN